MSTEPTEPFQWTHFLTTARQLSQSQDEGSLRSAVSRAYYAAFHDARCYLEESKRTTDGGSEHEKVWRAFGKSTDKREFRQIWNWATRLRDARIDADYRLDPKQNWRAQADVHIDSAQKMISLLAQLRKKL